jgi:hypothetical protein
MIINLQIYTSIIALHRACVWRLRYSTDAEFETMERTQQRLRQSDERLLMAADEIAHVLRMAEGPTIALHNPVLNFAVYLACLVFLENFLNELSQQSQSTAYFLLDFLVSAGESNTVAKSLASQIAKDMIFVGIEAPTIEVSRAHDGSVGCFKAHSETIGCGAGHERLISGRQRFVHGQCCLSSTS